MAYTPASHRKSPSSGVSRGKIAGTIFFAIIFVVIFGGSVYAFRRSAAKNVKPSAAELDTSNPNSNTPASIDLPSQSVPFNDVENGGGKGQATREIQNGKLHLTLTATLPTIDRTTISYEGWLVSRYPFNYVPLGELTTDQTGAFVLDWTSTANSISSDPSTYTWLVITRQLKTDDANPGPHVVEANFTP